MRRKGKRTNNGGGEKEKRRDRLKREENVLKMTRGTNEGKEIDEKGDAIDVKLITGKVNRMR